MTAPVDVLYIAGWGRSGSTLLARLLGEHPSMTFVGEVRGTWLRGVAENRRCGCGAPFDRCPFWTAVGEEAFGGWDRSPTEEALDLRERVDKPWWVPLHRNGRSGGPLARDVARYSELFTRVFLGIRSVVGPDVMVVDSSKIPSFAWLVDRSPDVRLRAVHLVRDPRGTVHSWRKRVARFDESDGAPAEMIRYRVPGASYRYVGYNRQAEGLRDLANGYVFTRYEDLVAAPGVQLDRIAERLDLPGWRAGQVDGDRVRLGASHSVVGNPMRMQTGWVPLRADVAWRTDMPRPVQAFVTAVTSPALHRYGYPMRPETQR